MAYFEFLDSRNNQVAETKHSTEWKCKNFSVTQILREINFGDCRSSKTVFFAIIKALNFLILVIFSPQEVQNYPIQHILRL